MFYKEQGIKIIRSYGKTLKAVYYGANIVWQAIRSCFGAGYWVNDKVWINEENWKN